MPCKPVSMRILARSLFCFCANTLAADMRLTTPTVGHDVRVSGNLQTQCIKAHAVVVTHGARETLAQDITQVCADELDKGTGRFGCPYSKLGVVGAPVALFQVAVGTGHVGDAVGAPDACQRHAPSAHAPLGNKPQSSGYPMTQGTAKLRQLRLVQFAAGLGG